MSLNQIIYISGNYESTKIADHIWEMAGLGFLYDFCVIKNIA